MSFRTVRKSLAAIRLLSIFALLIAPFAHRITTATPPTDPRVLGEHASGHSTVVAPSGGKESPDPTSEPAASDDESIRALGQTMLKALQDNDIEKFLGCWLNEADFDNLLAKPPTGAPSISAEERAQMKDYLRKRDRFVRLSFPMLRRALTRTSGNLAGLHLSDISGDVKIRNGIKRVAGFDILFTTPTGVQIGYSVDDGAYANGRWYFTDRPDNHIAIDPKGQDNSVFLKDFATDEERVKLDSLLAE